MHDLSGKRGLIVGIANRHSIAHGCASVMRAAGAELALAYLNEKVAPYALPLAAALGSSLVEPCDVRVPGQLERLFARIGAAWGRLDFVLHSIAYAPKDELRGRLLDCSAAGFALAMDVTCHSFVRMAKLAAPLMPGGGCLLTVSYLGAQRVIPGYGMMGPVKAALECSVRYLAAELGRQGIRVHAISAGPIRTRAASGLPNFDALLADAAARSPAPALAGIEDVGSLAAFLVGDGARALTGNVEYVDAGYHVMG